MRIRTIKPEFFTHEGLFDAEEETGLPLRLAFIGLWCAADREGRFKWEPRRLGVLVMPYDKIDFSRVLDALTTRGLVVKYRVGDDDFGVIPSFVRHQIINNRERPSDLPEPPSLLDRDASTTRQPRVPHAGTVEGKGREGKGREGEEEEASSSTAAPERMDLNESERLSAEGNYLAALAARVGLTEDRLSAAVRAMNLPPGCFETYLRNRAAEDWRTPRGNKPVGFSNWVADLQRFTESFARNEEASRPEPLKTPLLRKLPDNWREIASGLFGREVAADFEDLSYDDKGDLLRHLRGPKKLEPTTATTAAA